MKDICQATGIFLCVVLALMLVWAGVTVSIPNRSGWAFEDNCNAGTAYCVYLYGDGKDMKLAAFGDPRAALDYADRLNRVLAEQVGGPSRRK